MARIIYPKKVTQKWLREFNKDPYYSSFFKSIVNNKIQEGKIKLVK